MSPTKQAVNGFPRAQTGAPQPYHSARAPEREIGDLGARGQGGMAGRLGEKFLQGENISFAENDKPPNRHFIGFFQFEKPTINPLYHLLYLSTVVP